MCRDRSRHRRIKQSAPMWRPPADKSLRWRRIFATASFESQTMTFHRRVQNFTLTLIHPPKMSLASMAVASRAAITGADDETDRSAFRIGWRASCRSLSHNPIGFGLRRAHARGRCLGPRDFARRRRRGELLAARLVREPGGGSPGGAGLVALHLQLLYKRDCRWQRGGRARSRHWPLHPDGDGQSVREPQGPGGTRMGPTELHFRDPGFRRPVDREPGGVCRLAERQPDRDAYGHDTRRAYRYPLRQHQQLRHRSQRPLSVGVAEMERRRQQFHDLWDRRHSGRRV